MAYYNKSWSHRWPVLIDNSTGGTSAIDLSIVVPSVFPDFWDNVDSAGDDIRVADADGVTLLTYQLTGFNYANKTVTVEVDNWTPPLANSMCQVWLYWGNAAAASAAGSFTATTPLTGYVHPGAAAEPIVVAERPVPGATRPSAAVSKTTDEKLYAWLDVGDLLERLQTAYAGRLDYEEIESLTYEVLNAGTDETSEKDYNEMRLLPGNLIRLHHKGGSDNDDRTLCPILNLTTGRTINPRVLLNVRDIDEA